MREPVERDWKLRMTREICRGVSFLGRTKLLDQDPERGQEMKNVLRAESCEILERSPVLADAVRKSLSKKKSWKMVLRLCKSKESLLKQEEVLILGDSVGCN